MRLNKRLTEIENRTGITVDKRPIINIVPDSWKPDPEKPWITNVTIGGIDIEKDI